MEFVRTLQSWGYVVMVFALTIGLYYYIYYLYKRQKDGTKDYEKYSKMALNDNIDDIPVESINPHENEKDK